MEWSTPSVGTRDASKVAANTSPSALKALFGRSSGPPTKRHAVSKRSFVNASMGEPPLFNSASDGVGSAVRFVVALQALNWVEFDDCTHTHTHPRTHKNLTL